MEADILGSLRVVAALALLLGTSLRAAAAVSLRSGAAAPGGPSGAAFLSSLTSSLTSLEPLRTSPPAYAEALLRLQRSAPAGGPEALAARVILGAAVRPAELPAVQEALERLDPALGSMAAADLREVSAVFVDAREREVLVSRLEELGKGLAAEAAGSSSIAARLDALFEAGASGAAATELASGASLAPVAGAADAALRLPPGIGAGTGERVARALDGAYAQYLGYASVLAQLGHMYGKTGNFSRTPESYAAKEGELARERDAYAAGLVLAGGFSEPSGALAAYRAALDEPRFYQLQMGLKTLGAAAPARAAREGALMEAALRAAIDRLSRPPQESGPASWLSAGAVLEGTPLWRRLEDLNGGHGVPAIVSASGGREEALDRLQAGFERVANDALALVAADVDIGGGRRRSLLILDKASRLRSRAALEALLDFRFNLNDHGFELTFVVDEELKNVHFHKVGLEGGGLRGTGLRGRRLMREVYANLEALLRERFAGWTISAVVADERTVLPFMRRLGAVRAGPAQERMIDRYEPLTGTINRRDVEAMFGRISAR